MEVVKKHLNEDENGSINDDCGITSAGNGSTIPKKRGRPSNPDKVKKIPSGRGRGRPSKNYIGGSSVSQIASEPVSVDDIGTVAANRGVGRGRPSKIVTPGKGRGRPKKQPQPSEEGADETTNCTGYDDERGGSKPSDKKRGRKTKSLKKPGRPRKANVDNKDEDDEGVSCPCQNYDFFSGDEDGGITAARGNGSTIPKKRGRPSNPDKVKTIPSGRGRGRPSKLVTLGKGRGRPKKQPRASEENNEETSNGPGDEDDGQGGSKPSGKKRGHKPKSLKKPGRPKKAKSDDEDENDESDAEIRVSTDGRDHGKKAIATKRPSTANGSVQKKRGRPAGTGKIRPLDKSVGRNSVKEGANSEDEDLQDKDGNDYVLSSEDDKKKFESKNDTEEEEVGANSNSKKKRGRPAGTGKIRPLDKSVGRNSVKEGANSEDEDLQDKDGNDYVLSSEDDKKKFESKNDTEEEEVGANSNEDYDYVADGEE